MLADILSRYWWMTLLRGLFWILFGIVLFARPDISLLSLTLALGVGSEYSCSRSGCRAGHFLVTGKLARSVTELFRLGVGESTCPARR